MVQSNCMRNLSGASLSNPCWPRQPAAACAAAGSCGSSGAFCFIPVVPGVLLCWLARSLPCVRYKILPAWLLGGENGTKLSLHVEKAPNRAISGEQGEFCTGSGAVRLVQGEFCTGSGAARLVLGEFCFVVAPSVYAVAGFPPPTGAPSWPSRPCSALDTGSGGGFALHEALNRCVAGVSHPLVVQCPPSRGLPDGRGAQNADHLAKKR